MLRLELGCGNRPTPGYVHHDRTRHGPHVDVAHDLEEVPWPWRDGEWDEVVAFDVLEHLRPWRCDIDVWLDELWRIVRVGGTVRLRLPDADNRVSYRDPTHRRVFTEETLLYWCPPHPLWQHYGRIYYPDAGWWACVAVRFVNADPRYGAPDVEYTLRKRAERGWPFVTPSTP